MGFSPGLAQYDSTGRTKLASRKICSVGFEWTLKTSRASLKMSVENFLEPGNRKNLTNARITAGLKLRESSRSLSQRTTCMSGPQAVREDRFQKCIGFHARRLDAIVAVAAGNTLS